MWGIVQNCSSQKNVESIVFSEWIWNGNFLLWRFGGGSPEDLSARLLMRDLSGTAERCTTAFIGMIIFGFPGFDGLDLRFCCYQ